MVWAWRALSHSPETDERDTSPKPGHLPIRGETHMGVIAGLGLTDSIEIFGPLKVPS